MTIRHTAGAAASVIVAAITDHPIIDRDLCLSCDAFERTGAGFVRGLTPGSATVLNAS
ncbi:MAG: hypothetical protein IMW90_09660 [Thermogemmatispora sp.]|nr:hypothetical protein [Thermogemmatispora sp.]